MTETGGSVVPVWTLATRDTPLPAIPLGNSMTPERLAEIRTVLAAVADAPIATLDARPVPADFDRSSGLALSSASPLATHLSQLVSSAPKTGAAAAALSGETLYRMVVPAKVAGQLGTNMVKPMASKAVAGGVHSALTGSKGIVAQASFVPVKAGSAAGAGVAAAGAGALTVAAPLVMMAVAVGVSAHAEHKRQQAIENITALLEKLHSDALQRERSALNGCRDAIEKAQAILLDQGRVGVSLGLDSAVYAINTALVEAEERLKKWLAGLDEIGDAPVEIAKLKKTFAGIDQETGEFYAHLELAQLAIALKKRVILIQAVEHAQHDPANPFENFVQTLRSDQQKVSDLESGVEQVLLRLSDLQLDRSRGIRDKVFSSGAVDNMLRTSHRLHQLGNRVALPGRSSDVEIEMVRSRDGSVVVLPARRVDAA
ncbi:hypothetical protein [Mycolicibacterium iranicum]|uniref:Uncharacterized protein n=1 Tax=Mycolicibacterium iranicum TaxID=912594 RepID=A0A1X1WSY6_MYCIR|nr:hypothetical protein [Mycolicibacterium iranicum]ORV89765.1 hypothetical protein AWC12_08645 [Mycolicibacterium iranicum]